MLLYLLATVAGSLMLAGAFLFFRSIGTKDPFRLPKFLLAVPVLVVAMGLVSQQQRANAPVAQSTGEVVSFITPPGEESSVPFTAPAPAPTPVASERTPAQNLSLIADRNLNDPEVASKFVYLDSLCPEDGAKVGDIVVNLQQLVKSQSGRTLDIVYVMDQLATAQEGGVQAGNMRCVDTAALLSVLLEKE